MLVNAANGGNETTLREVQEAARVIGLQIQVFNVSTSGEIDAAFAAITRERLDAIQFATLKGVHSRDSCDPLSIGVQFWL